MYLCLMLSKNLKNIKARGEPNSSTDLLNPDGYAVENIDYTHSDVGTHEFPHRHFWDWDKSFSR